MPILPQSLPRQPEWLRMQHEAEALPPGAQEKLARLYGANWRQKVWGNQEGEPEPSMLLLHDLLHALPSTRILMGIRPEHAPRVQRLIEHWGLAERCRLVETSGEASMWTRDTAVHLLDESGLSLFAPKSFRADDPVAEHSGAAESLRALARSEKLTLSQSCFMFEGGDVLAARTSGPMAFVGEGTLERNYAYLGHSREAVCRGLEHEFGVPVHVLPSYTYHLDLSLCFPEEGVALMADPILGMEVAEAALSQGDLEPGEADELAAMIRETRGRDGIKLLYIQRYLSELGFRVIGLPFLHGVGDNSSDPDLRRTAIASYHNGLFYREPGSKVAVLGSSGFKALDRAAEDVYRGLGWDVRWVPGAAISTMLLGGVRCATSELAFGV